MKIKKGYFGHDLTLILEGNELLVLFAPSGEHLVLLVNQHGKLVFFCETDVIETISGKRMAEKIRKGLYGINHDHFLNYCLDWEVLTNGEMFAEVTVLVPASDMRVCTYLGLRESGKFFITGGASITQSIIGPHLEQKNFD